MVTGVIVISCAGWWIRQDCFQKRMQWTCFLFSDFRWLFLLIQWFSPGWSVLGCFCKMDMMPFCFFDMQWQREYKDEDTPHEWGVGWVDTRSIFIAWIQVVSYAWYKTIVGNTVIVKTQGLPVKNTASSSCGMGIYTIFNGIILWYISSREL